MPMPVLQKLRAALPENFRLLQLLRAIGNGAAGHGAAAGETNGGGLDSTAARCC